MESRSASPFAATKECRSAPGDEVAIVRSSGSLSSNGSSSLMWVYLGVCLLMGFCTLTGARFLTIFTLIQRIQTGVPTLRVYLGHGLL